MRKLYKRTSLVVAASIGFSLTPISASFSRAALTPTATKNQMISDSPMLLAQGKQKVNSAEILAADNKYREEVGVSPLI